ncbi:hypothetical protein [Prevotella fusca]|uniref:DUF4377 domain-containing protein n=1 Tax=Prevotella fusca JCM 17724 TaxID=1236517 RepID=A0ABX7XZG6_9BACT|nr:hypothetical protein [Prevotella fusca]QUB87139.1 hypothetical protein J5A51_06570 [Prevotella fusca JCM 17724]
MKPKGDVNGYPLNAITGRYYTAAEQKDKFGYDYKLIVYNITDDNDTEVCVSQLNSYIKGTLVDNGLKNHDIISSKTSTDKGKNTCKKQVCNQQEISQL